MKTLDLREAIDGWGGFDDGKKAKIELTSARAPDLALEIVKGFLARGHAQGWSFDESLEWDRSDPPARGVDAMMALFHDLVFVKGDGAAARKLRDQFLTFLPEEQLHVPILEALYAHGWALGEDGTLIQ